MFKIKPCMCVHALVCGYEHVTTGACNSQRHQDPWNRLLQVVVSHPTWALETELRSCARVPNSLNHRTIPVDPIFF